NALHDVPRHQEDAERPERHTDAEHRHDGVIPDDYRSSRSSVGTHFVTLRVIKRTQSVQTGMPDAEHRHDGVTPDDYRSTRSSMGMHFVTLRVIKRTQSVQNGMPTQSIGTMVLFLTTIVPHAPAWERTS
ncbi:hypothetical protein P4A93_22835, partial [Pseudomonas syringae pv. syringae]|uniref:hypothetical protein n=1 Tax=Pseudomonas syringae TaxID=317 RepID=UPI0023FA2676